MNTKTITEIAIGTGILTWAPKERRSDRYGFVQLMPDGSSSLSTTEPEFMNLSREPKDGTFGTLIAIVLETRKSTHIGDLFRGVRPRQTPAGTRVVLGRGKLVRESPLGQDSIGVCPEEGAERWLDIRALYDTHEHMVELVFVPGAQDEEAFSA